MPELWRQAVPPRLLDRGPVRCGQQWAPGPEGAVEAPGLALLSASGGTDGQGPTELPGRWEQSRSGHVLEAEGRKAGRELSSSASGLSADVTWWRGLRSICQSACNPSTLAPWAALPVCSVAVTLFHGDLLTHPCPGQAEGLAAGTWLSVPPTFSHPSLQCSLPGRAGPHVTRPGEALGLEDKGGEDGQPGGGGEWPRAAGLWVADLMGGSGTWRGGFALGSPARVEGHLEQPGGRWGRPGRGGPEEAGGDIEGWAGGQLCGTGTPM